MIPSVFMRRTVRPGFVALVLAVTAAAAVAADRKMEARLIWGTNDEKSPDPKHKLLDGELAKKLRDMPLKWKNYFSGMSRSFFASSPSKSLSLGSGDF